MRDFRLPGDELFFRIVNGLGIPALDWAFTLASTHVFGIGVAGALGLWLASTYRARAVRPFAQAVLSAGLADLIGARLLKPLIGRTRPSYALPHDAARVLAESANVGSMPSLHAATSFAVAMTLFILCPQIGRIAIPVAAFISLSRVGVGVHWPSDVIVGAVYGSALAMGVEWAARRIWGVFDSRPEDLVAKSAFSRGAAGIEAARAERERR